MPWPKTLHSILLTTALSAASAWAGPVITWVPPYSVAASKTMLQRDFGGIGMKDGLTYLALQFWVTNGPSVNQWGAVAGSGFDGNVTWFRDWGKSHGVKVTLCVVDYVGGWNWDEARRSFIDNRAAFVNSLVAEVDRLGLDGVDLDLEGPVTPTRNDSVQFMALTRELAAALHPKGKVVNVASYAAQYNAPNWNWWPEIMKSADAVTSMGYDEAGMNNPAGWKYPEQKKHANPAWKLMQGMFGSSESWQGNTAAQQIDWVVNDGQMGLAIWDATLGGPTWESAATWQKIKRIRDNTPTGIAARNTRASNGMLSLRQAADGVFADISLSKPSRVRVRVFDMQGGLVSELFRGARPQGALSLHWPKVDENVANGSYRVSVQAGGESATQGISLIR